jgi:MFS family permease
MIFPLGFPGLIAVIAISLGKDDSSSVIDMLDDTPLGYLMQLVRLKPDRSDMRSKTVSHNETPSPELGFDSAIEQRTSSEKSSQSHHERPDSNLTEFSKTSVAMSTRSASLTREPGRNLSNPRHFSNSRKQWIVAVAIIQVLVASSISSFMVPIEEHISAHYQISSHVASLTFSLYVLGAGLGCASTSYLIQRQRAGRNALFTSVATLFAIVAILLAVIDSFAALLTLRFVQGFFGGVLIICSLASITDVYDPTQDPYASMIYSAALYIGPSLGILLSSWSTTETWDQTHWDAFGISGLAFLLNLLLPETSPSPSSPSSHTIASDKSAKRTTQTQHDETITHPRPPLFQQYRSRNPNPSLLLSLTVPTLLTAPFYALLPTTPSLFPTLHARWTQSLTFALSTTIGAAVLLRASAVFLVDYHIPRTSMATPNKGWLKPALATSPIASLALLLLCLTRGGEPAVHFLVPATAIALFVGAGAVVAHCSLLYAFSILGRGDEGERSLGIMRKSGRAGVGAVRMLTMQLGFAYLLSAGLLVAFGVGVDARRSGEVKTELGALVGVCALGAVSQWVGWFLG